MAKEKVQVEVEEDIDLGDLEVGEIEIEEVPDAVEAELSADEKKAAKAKAKAEKAAAKAEKGEGLTSTAALKEGEVGVKYIADILGVDQRLLRGYLRKHFRNMDEQKSQRYRWMKDDPQIQEIIDGYKAKPVREAKAEVAAPVADAATEAVVEIDDEI